MHLIYVKASPEMTKEFRLEGHMLFLSQQECAYGRDPLCSHVHCLQPCVKKQSLLQSRQVLVFGTLFMSQPG